jgi:ketosteroid isomerase-like protein
LELEKFVTSLFILYRKLQKSTKPAVMRTKLFILLAACIVACNPNPSSQVASSTTDESDFNLDSVKAHIEKMNKSYAKRFTTKDRTFYEERYCKDAAVYCPNVPPVIGIDSIVAFFYTGENSNLIMELPPNDIYGNADLVVEDGTYNFPDGKGGSLDKGKFIALWKKEDGKWKLYREIWNTDLPPAKQ